MMLNKTERDKMDTGFKKETLLIVITFAIQLFTVIGYFTQMENRLTKIETTIEIKLNSPNQPYYPPVLKDKTEVINI